MTKGQLYRQLINDWAIIDPIEKALIRKTVDTTWRAAMAERRRQTKHVKKPT